MNTKPVTLNMQVRLSHEAAQSLPAEAAKFGLSPEEMASAILNAEFPFGSLSDDECGAATLSQIKALYPERWPMLKVAYSEHVQALERENARDREQVDSILDQTITLTLPPGMILFMRDLERPLPELWNRFVLECIDAVFDSLQNYVAGTYSFKTPKDRRETLRLIGVAKRKYLHATQPDHKVNL